MSAPIPVPIANLPTERCPHCGIVAVVQPSPTLRWVCGVCGKARVPVAGEAERVGPETEALARASAARTSSVVWLGASAFATAFGLLAFAILALVYLAAHPPLVATIAAAFAALVPLLIAAYGFRRAAAKKREIQPALDEAWALAVRDVVERGGATRPEELAKKIGIHPNEAERLFLQLSTDGVVASRVTDDGAIEYEPMRPRVRVAEKARAGDVATEKEARAEAEAAEAEARR